jgi:hypothetical protein
MPGTKTSVWLGEEQYAQWKASGDSLTEIVKRGLAAGDPESLDEKIGRLLDEKLAPVLERLDSLPDAAEIRRIVERVAGQSHD